MPTRNLAHVLGRPRTAARMAALAILLIALSGCEQALLDSGSSIPLTVDVAVEATSMTVVRDCDEGTSRGPGDFHVIVSLNAHDEAGNEVLLERSPDTLVQLNDGQGRGLSILAGGTVDAVDGKRVIARVSFYENDTGGPQVSRGIGHTLTYDGVTGCWHDSPSGSCLGPTGDLLTDSLVLEDYAGDACLASLRFRITAGPAKAP